MKQKLVIELDEQATKNYLKWLEPVHQHCAGTNCEFPGFSLKIDVLPTIEEIVYGVDDDGLTELGDVKVKLVKFQEH